MMATLAPFLMFVEMVYVPAMRMVAMMAISAQLIVVTIFWDAFMKITPIYVMMATLAPFLMFVEMVYVPAMRMVVTMAINVQTTPVIVHWAASTSITETWTTAAFASGPTTV